MQQAGQSLAVIARALRVTERHADRELAATALLGSEVAPTELILRVAVDGADRDTL
jgi:hypothetical protein